MKFTVTVMIEAESQSQAEQVVSERLGHDEDYGFEYSLDWGGVDYVEELDLDEEQLEKEEEEDEHSVFPYNEIRRSGANIVVIEYHGSGDEGYIEDIHGWVGEPEVSSQIALSDGLTHVLRNTAYDVLGNKYGGWEINEGSSGTIKIDALNKTATLNHGWFVETQEWQDAEVI